MLIHILIILNILIHRHRLSAFIQNFFHFTRIIKFLAYKTLHDLLDVIIFLNVSYFRVILMTLVSQFHGYLKIVFDKLTLTFTFYFKDF
jgi:hypothetical protein